MDGSHQGRRALNNTLNTGGAAKSALPPRETPFERGCRLHYEQTYPQLEQRDHPRADLPDLIASRIGNSDAHARPPQTSRRHRAAAAPRTATVSVPVQVQSASVHSDTDAPRSTRERLGGRSDAANNAAAHGARGVRLAGRHERSKSNGAQQRDTTVTLAASAAAQSGQVHQTLDTGNQPKPKTGARPRDCSKGPDYSFETDNPARLALLKSVSPVRTGAVFDDSDGGAAQSSDVEASAPLRKCARPSGECSGDGRRQIKVGAQTPPLPSKQGATARPEYAGVRTRRQSRCAQFLKGLYEVRDLMQYCDGPCTCGLATQGCACVDIVVDVYLHVFREAAGRASSPAAPTNGGKADVKSILDGADSLRTSPEARAAREHCYAPAHGAHAQPAQPTPQLSPRAVRYALKNLCMLAAHLGRYYDMTVSVIASSSGGYDFASLHMARL